MAKRNTCNCRWLFAAKKLRAQEQKPPCLSEDRTPLLAVPKFATTHRAAKEQRKIASTARFAEGMNDLQGAFYVACNLIAHPWRNDRRQELRCNAVFSHRDRTNAKVKASVVVFVVIMRLTASSYVQPVVTVVEALMRKEEGERFRWCVEKEFTIGGCPLMDDRKNSWPPTATIGRHLDRAESSNSNLDEPSVVDKSVDFSSAKAVFESLEKKNRPPTAADSSSLRSTRPLIRKSRFQEHNRLLSPLGSAGSLHSPDAVPSKPSAPPVPPKPRLKNGVPTTESVQSSGQTTAEEAVDNPIVEMNLQFSRLVSEMESGAYSVPSKKQSSIGDEAKENVPQRNVYEPYWRSYSWYARRYGAEKVGLLKTPALCDLFDSERKQPTPVVDDQSPNAIEPSSGLWSPAEMGEPADSAGDDPMEYGDSLNSLDRLQTIEGDELRPTEVDHYWTEVPGLMNCDDEQGAMSKVKFSTEPIRVYSTYGVNEYDRRNDDVDPIAASAEYELERRLENMDIFEVELRKGPQGLGFSIIGMGVGADAGLEKLGIFVKSISPNGAVALDGRIQVCDQIIEVDKKSLIGVSQAYAASILRSTSGTVTFKLGREKDPENSEIGALIRQSLEQDKQLIQERVASRIGVAVSPLSVGGHELIRDASVAHGEPTESRACWEQAFRKDATSGADLYEPASARMQQPVYVHANQEILRDVQLVREPAPPYGAASVIRRSAADGEAPAAPQTALVAPSLCSHGDGPNAVQDTKLDSIRSVQQAIALLEEELLATKRETEKFQSLLSNSRGQFQDLERKYADAKELIKDYQIREKDLLSREEIHLKVLREKDEQYNALIRHLEQKVVELEQQWVEAKQKRASLIAEAVNGDTEEKQPLRNITNRSNVKAATDMITPLVNANRDEEHKSMHTTTIEIYPTKEACTDDLDMPDVQLLDNRAVKSKSEAVRNSLVMCSRQPPSRLNGSEHQLACNQEDQRSNSLRSGCSQSLRQDSLDDGAGQNCSPRGFCSLDRGLVRSPASARRFTNMLLRKKNPYPAVSLDPEIGTFVTTSEMEKNIEVLSWDCDDVCQFLKSVGLEKYIPEFAVNGIDGPKLLCLDGSKLKAIGIYNHADRALIKKRVKDLKSFVVKERKMYEKEQKRMLKLSDK
uniref:Neurabin-1 n=1 Tax=Trichuris muris TaxID=70415 RepID=A0A5S6QFU0_TRIMR